MSKLFVHLSFCQYNGLWISHPISLQHLSFRFYSIVNAIITHLKQHIQSQILWWCANPFNETRSHPGQSPCTCVVDMCFLLWGLKFRWCPSTAAVDCAMQPGTCTFALVPCRVGCLQVHRCKMTKQMMIQDIQRSFGMKSCWHFRCCEMCFEACRHQWVAHESVCLEGWWCAMERVMFPCVSFCISCVVLKFCCWQPKRINHVVFN